MKRFLAIFLLIFSLCLALFFTASKPFVSKGPEAVEGVLDVRGTDFTSQVYALSGQWEFYHGQLYTPEDFRQGTAKGGSTLTCPVPGPGWGIQNLAMQPTGSKS